MKKHELKILPQYFQAVWSGIKTFELRKDDRDYQLGIRHLEPGDMREES